MSGTEVLERMDTHIQLLAHTRETEEVTVILIPVILICLSLQERTPGDEWEADESQAIKRISPLPFK